MVEIDTSFNRFVTVMKIWQIATMMCTAHCCPLVYCTLMMLVARTSAKWWKLIETDELTSYKASKSATQYVKNHVGHMLSLSTEVKLPRTLLK